jgi:hypothetical protein
MKLKSLKFILLPALFLPYFCFALTTLNFSVDFVEDQYTPFLNLNKPVFIHSLRLNNLYCTSDTGVVSIYCNDGGQILGYFYCQDLLNGLTFPVEITLDEFYSEECSVFSSSGNGTIEFQLTIGQPSIGNTQNWLSLNEILGYIGKLAEDIPSYIALVIGLPFAFWFIEKTIAFVRGNFRPVEKIKEE